MPPPRTQVRRCLACRAAPRPRVLALCAACEAAVPSGLKAAVWRERRWSARAVAALRRCVRAARERLAEGGGDKAA